MLPYTAHKIWKVEAFLGFVALCWGMRLLMGVGVVDIFDTSANFSILREHIGELAFSLILIFTGAGNLVCLVGHIYDWDVFGIIGDKWLLFRRFMAVVAACLWTAVGLVILAAQMGGVAHYTYIIGFGGLWWTTAYELSPGRVARALVRDRY